ncbi:DUF1835 domain-containing protein [Halobacillus ihumii]|uniref:DUF1835 domain-containing protein n=1 Tax=Halobacillus ihumii TaxID=2686092 RepID=UPI0013D44AE4|nr:DUF1835 domain-containing protein [Halobacillus ihumii]
MRISVDKVMESLNEEEAQSLLKQVLLRIDLIETTSYPEKQFVTDLLDLKRRIYGVHDFRTNPRKEYEDQDVRKIHIVFDESSGGSLGVALKKNLGTVGEKVISFPDILSKGPVWQLHTQEGVRNRKDWLFYHINLDEEYLEGYEDKFAKVREQIEAIPPTLPITIWYGDNAHEQTGLRFALYLLQQASNPIFLINSTHEYNRVFSDKIRKYYPLSTSEISPEKLAAIYHRSPTEEVDPKQRKRLETEWSVLSSSKENLRIWQNGQVDAVSEDFLDDLIIKLLRNIHKERGSSDFVKSARLIGEVIGHSSQLVGDDFVEYRVRQLIVNGIFDLKGVPKAMRFYEVKFHSS